MKISRIFSVFALSIIAGCGGGPDDAVPLAAIEGVAQIDGVPIDGPVVTFHPETGPTGVGVGNSVGEFKIKTNGQNGAPIGKCKVTVVASGIQGGEIPEMDGNEGALSKLAVLDTKYASKETTDLIIDVTEDGNTQLVLDLDSK